MAVGEVILQALRVVRRFLACTAHHVDVHKLAHATLAGLGAQVDDGIEQLGVGRAEIGDRRLFAGPGEGQIDIAIERDLAGPDLRRPGVEPGLVHCLVREAHMGEARARIIGGKAGARDGLVGDGMQLRLHPRHRVDLARQFRNVKAVHDGRCGDVETHRHIGGQNQLVDGRNAKVGIDKQPFPVERDDFHRHRLDLGVDGGLRVDPVERPIGVQLVRADPGQRAQRDDDQQRRRPDQQFQLGAVIPIGIIVGIGRLVGRAIAHGEDDDERHDRQHDQQHQRRRNQDQVALLQCNIARRVHHDPVTARERRCQNRNGPAQKPDP